MKGCAEAMQEEIRMCDLRPGQTGVVTALDYDNPITERLMDLGLVEGSIVTCLGRSLWNDPTAYRICGAVVALRQEICRNVLLKEICPWTP